MSIRSRILSTAVPCAIGVVGALLSLAPLSASGTDVSELEATTSTVQASTTVLEATTSTTAVAPSTTVPVPAVATPGVEGSTTVPAPTSTVPASEVPAAGWRPAEPWLPTSLPLCATDEGEYFGDCVWAADRQGNGEGRSYVWVQGSLIYLSHSEAASLGGLAPSEAAPAAPVAGCTP